MQYQSLIGYLLVIVFTMAIVFAQANKEREEFAGLLQQRKHLNGYWVGKRYIVDDEPYLNSEDDLSAAKRASYLVGKRGTYLVGKRASFLVGRKRRDLISKEH